MTYTMHNILLPDGTESMPGRPLLSDTPEVKRMIAFTKEHFKPGSTVIDLGAGEGGYAIAFARAGYNVIAVEPREENVRKIRAARLPSDCLAIRGCSIEDYCQQYAAFPDGCLILCLGLLYHLEDPARVLATLAHVSRGLILSTHYAIPYHWQYDQVPPAGSWLLKRICKRLPGLFHRTHYGLSQLTTHNGRQGRWYPEYSRTEKNVSKLTHSACRNHRSFWLTQIGITEITRQSGLFCIQEEHRIKDQSFTGYYLRKH